MEIYLSVHGCIHMQATDEAAVFRGMKSNEEEKPD